MIEVRVEPLGESNVRAWGELFVRASSPCFCRWWHFAGTKNDWLARCALAPDASRTDAEGAVRVGGEDALGLVALHGATAVGWMKVAPRASLPKLRGLPVYRAVDLGPDEGIWAIGCFLVDPGHRGRGVAAALLDAAPSFARARGGRALEAYPRRAHEAEGGRLHDEEALMGPEALFVSRGFEPLPTHTAFYPVYRRSLVV